MASTLTLLHEASFDGEPLKLLRQHRFNDRSVFPGVAYLELAWRAGRALWGASPALRDISFEQPLVLPDDAVRLRVMGARDVRDATEFEIHSESTRHARGQLISQPPPLPPPPVLDELRARCSDPLDAAAFYAMFRSLGYDYGAEFAIVRALWRGTTADGRSAVLAQLDTAPAAARWSGFELPSGLLDGCIQPLFACFGIDGVSRMPSYIEQLAQARPLTAARWVHVTLRPSAGGADQVGDVVVLDEHGALVASIDGLRLRATAPLAPTAAPVAATPSGAGADDDARRDIVRRVQRVVMDVLELDASAEVRPDERLNELGVDSLLALDISSALAKHFGCKLPRTLLFDHPDINALADYIAGVKARS